MSQAFLRHCTRLSEQQFHSCMTSISTSKSVLHHCKSAFVTVMMGLQQLVGMSIINCLIQINCEQIVNLPLQQHVI